MAKKKGFKKRTKKTRQRPVQAAPSVQALAMSDEPANSVTATAKSVATAADPKMTYIKQDLQRVITLVSSFIVVQLILWYVLTYTSAGTAVYSLIKV